MKVSEIMTREVECINPGTTIQAAAEKMKTLDCGSLPICDSDRLTGMVTDRDIAIRATAEGKDPTNTHVSEIMTSEVSYCFENDDVADAAQQMSQKQIRRLCVLNEDKRLVGMVSLGDLATESDNPQLGTETLEKVSQ